MTAPARDWKEHFGWLARQVCPTMLTGPLAMHIIIGYRYARDIDSSNKLAQDALQGIAYENDSQIKLGLQTIYKSPVERFRVIVSPLESFINAVFFAPSLLFPTQAA